MLGAYVDILVNSLYETLVLFPYLFLTYLLMEYLEHSMSRYSLISIRRSKQYGPILGAFLGLIPQCGFSVSASNLYRTGLITLGTMIAIFLSTSDEMIPILISGGVEGKVITKILTIKLIFSIIVGILIDRFLPSKFIKTKNQPDISAFCKQERCNCEEKKESIYKLAFKHTEKISIFIFIMSLIINTYFTFMGYQNIKDMLISAPILSKFISAFVGIIPSCYPTVLLSQFYLDGIISLSTLMTGSFSNAGLGLLVLYRINRNREETLRIIFLVYTISIILGLAFEFMPII